MKIAVIGNYPPRKCGIATFTENFIQSILSVQDSFPEKDIQVEVFAMNDNEESYDYPSIVKMGIRQHETQDYDTAIEYINNSGFDYCHIQHEYGIFGGVSGIYVMQFLSRIQIPIAVTLHTVLKEPNFYQRQILYAMGKVANRIFVMSKLATRFLKTIYKIDEDKISIIEHGTPIFPESDKSIAQKKIGWDDRMNILTFGLLGRSKGVEVAIRALPNVIKKNPKVKYIILGKTHPHVVTHEGESYRRSLELLARDLKVEKHVEFLDQYASEEDLSNYLALDNTSSFGNSRSCVLACLKYSICTSTSTCSSSTLKLSGN